MVEAHDSGETSFSSGGQGRQRRGLRDVTFGEEGRQGADHTYKRGPEY